MTEQEAFLKEWIRDNLNLDVEYSENNAVKIGLRFMGENHAFTYEFLQLSSES